MRGNDGLANSLTPSRLLGQNRERVKPTNDMPNRSGKHHVVSFCAASVSALADMTSALWFLGGRG